MNPSTHSLPLDDILVLDLTRHYPGPLATRLLAEMGARVIKVESTANPDPIRAFPPFHGDHAAGDLVLNRSKESVQINFDDPRDRVLFANLVRAADILMEPFRPGVLDERGIGYRWSQTINPALVWVAITGYGQTGPDVGVPGHDINFLARSGLLDATGQPEGPPTLPAAQLADVAGGAYLAAMGAMAALIGRRASGKGQFVDVSMLEGTLSLLTLQAAQVAAGWPGDRGRMALSGAFPCYNVYPTRDHRFVALGALEPKFWVRFCRAITRDSWIPRQFEQGDGAGGFVKQVSDLFAARTLAEWVLLDQQHQFCLSPVNSIPEALGDPHLRERGSVQEFEGFTHLMHPIRFGKKALPIRRAAARPGTDTERIRREFGQDPDSDDH